MKPSAPNAAPGSPEAPPQRSPATVDAAVVALCAAILPVWGRQLAASRSQSEAAVTEMLSAFTEIGPHLDMAARQSRQVTAALAQCDGGVTDLAQACEDELAPVLERLDEQAAQAVRRVMGMIRSSVNALEEVVKPFVHETEMVSQQVERMYIGFQYQDRISQMMTLLHEDIERLQAVLQQPGSDPAALAQADWLARLESQYAMAEQRHSHDGGATDTGKPAPDDGEELIFF